MARGSNVHHGVTEKGQKSKSRRPNPSLSYCQRLAQSLDRSDALSKKLDSAHQEQQSHSLLLSLPAEIRQHIFYNVLDDDDMLSVKLYVQELKLKRVCKTFEADMESVSRQWQARRAKLETMHIVQKGAFDSYIADLMAPVLSRAKALRTPKKLPRMPSRH